MTTVDANATTPRTPRLCGAVVLRDKGWDRFEAVAALPALESRLQRGVRRYGVRAYERQGEALRDEEDVHVADHKLHVREGRVTRTGLSPARYYIPGEPPKPAE